MCNPAGNTKADEGNSAMSRTENNPENKKPKKHRRWWVLACLIGLPVLAVAWPNFAALMTARGRLFENPQDVPPGRVGVVFGCDDKIGGRDNLYFRYRIEAAAALWKAGRLRCLIVSGDNRTTHYNEPLKMRQALIEAGVPAERIACDYAGLRTLDSVVRAKKIFGVEKVVFISQRFQNERAIYLAKANGMDAVGFNAKDVEGRVGWRIRLREVGARVKMWLDVNILKTRPRHLGKREKLPCGEDG